MDGDALVRVAAVSRNGDYSFSKPTRDVIVLVAGLGVDGDVHAGVTVRHRGRVRADPGQPNLRQVHLIHGELFDELRADGWQVEAGQLGENVTTRGLDLLGLPRGTVLRFGPPAVGDVDQAASTAGADRAPSEAAALADRALSGAVAGVDRAPLDAVAGVDRASSEAVAGVDRASSEAVAGVDRASSEAVAGVLAAAERSKLEPAAAKAVAALTAAIERFEAGERDAGGGLGGGAGPDRRAVVVVTGLRNPCLQINGFADGLLKKVAYADADGRFVRKAGVMGVVLRGGPVRPGDPVDVELPPSPHEALDRV